MLSLIMTAGCFSYVSADAADVDAQEAASEAAAVDEATEIVEEAPLGQEAVVLPEDSLSGDELFEMYLEEEVFAPLLSEAPRTIE